MKRNAFNLLILSLLLFQGGCAAPQRTRLFWPALPTPPKLEFINVHYSQDQFDKTGWQRFAEGIFGKPPLDKLRLPFGIAADGKGRVYLSEPRSGNIIVFDFNRRTVSPFTMQAVGEPFGLALDSAGNLYVADSKSQRILVYSPDRQPLFSFGGKEYFQKPLHVAINEKLGRIYVSDSLAHKVVVFDRQGTHLFSFGKRGSGGGEFNSPQGVALDRQGRLFVADNLNARIEVFDPDGKFLYQFGERGDTVAYLDSPKDLAFDSEGNLHVVDFRKAALLTFSPEGRMLLYTGTQGTSPQPTGFGGPTSLWIDGNDRIYIADLLNERFAVWQYLSLPYLERHPVPPSTLPGGGGAPAETSGK